MQLALALLETNPTAAVVLGLGEGYIANQRGSILEVVKCPKVMVTLRDTDVCYYDLPVYLNGSPMFRDPKHKILKKASVAIECGTDCSVHKLHGHYYRACPKITLAKDLEVDSIIPDHFEGDQYHPVFQSLGVIYEGSAVQDFMAKILMPTRQTTMTRRWAKDLTTAAQSSSTSSTTYFGATMSTMASVFSLFKSGFGKLHNLSQGFLTAVTLGFLTTSGVFVTVMPHCLLLASRGGVEMLAIMPGRGWTANQVSLL